jgi:hypothetical protein
MKLTIFTTSALVTLVLALPKPQLLDVNLGVGAKVTVFSTVTVTQPAAACLPAPATGSPIGLPSVKPSLSIPGVLPSSIAAPLPQLTSKPWPSVILPSIALPSVAKPSVSVPSIALPSPAVPSVAWPSLALPSVALPSIAVPSVAVPSIAKPSIVVPSLALPSLALPSIALPSIALPSIALPSIALPGLGLPLKPSPAQSSSWTQSTPSATSAPILQVPSIPGRITGTAQAYLSVGASYQAAILYHHNVARLNHGAAALIWDASCEAKALAAASTCSLANSVSGQNTYLSSTSAFNVTAAITETWYKNELSSLTPWFGIATLPVSLLPSVSASAQVLWKGTTRVGCASVDCTGKMKVNGVASGLSRYTVCNYAAVGGVNGLFSLNIGRPVSTTLGKWTD